MVRDGLALNTGSDPGSATHLLAIGTGDAAMTIEGSGVLGPIVNVLESGQYPDVEVGTGPLPGVRAGGGVQTAEGSLYIVNRSSPAKRGAAWQFIKYLDSTKELIRLHLETGYVPIRRSVADSPEVQARWAADPNYRVSYDQLLSGPDDPRHDRAGDRRLRSASAPPSSTGSPSMLSGDASRGRRSPRRNARPTRSSAAYNERVAP